MDLAPPVSFVGIHRPAFGAAAQHLVDAPPRKSMKAGRRYQRDAKTAAGISAGDLIRGGVHV